MKFKHIGEVISFFRKQLNMTQEELANKVGLNRVTVVKIENHQRAISLDEAVDISKALEMDIDAFYGYVAKKTEEEVEQKSFVMAFSSKGMEKEDLLEIKRIELLMDALFTQEEILRGYE